MRVQVAIDAQHRSMRSNLAQQAMRDEEADVLINGSQRHGRNAPPDIGIDLFGRIVSVGSNYSLVDHLTLVRRSQAELPGKIAELGMSQAHRNWMRMIIIRLRMFPRNSSKTIGKRKGHDPLKR